MCAGVSGVTFRIPGCRFSFHASARFVISGNSGISIICIYIHIIEISLRAEGRKSVKRHIITPEIMCISFKCRLERRDFSNSGMHISISRERAFCDFRKSQKFNNIHIYTRIIDISLRTGGRKMARIHIITPQKVLPS